MAGAYKQQSQPIALSIDSDDAFQEPIPGLDTRSLSISSRRPAGRLRTGPRTYKDYASEQIEHWQEQYADLNERLSPLQKVLLVLGIICAIVFGILFLVLYGRILSWLAPAAQKWRDLRGGWLILWFAIFFVSFPPLVGYGTCATLSGALYGVWRGWLIVASASVAGSAFSFFVCRRFLSGYMERRIARDRRFNAFALVLKQDGLKLLCMIRLCPLPYSLSNGAIATFPTVSWLNFVLATALATPKLMTHVFVGSRLALFADKDKEMDTGSKVVNYAGILFSIAIGVGTSWFVYRRIKAKAAQLEAAEWENEEEPPEDAISDEYSDEPSLEDGRLGRADGEAASPAHEYRD